MPGGGRFGVRGRLRKKLNVGLNNLNAINYLLHSNYTYRVCFIKMLQSIC